MKMSYYPGCSLKGTGRAYEESLLPVMTALGVELDELNDWNCCGATAYMAISEKTAFVLAGRNLALAEQTKQDLVAPCSGCYLVLNKTRNYIAEYPDVARQVQETLQKDGLVYRGTVKVRHPLDVIVNDIGLDAVKKRVVTPLSGLKIAPYYGCQIVRPFSTFDDQANPTSMDRLIEALGASVVRYPLKTRCCGGSLTGTVAEVGQQLGFYLLKEAARRGANLMTTTCPLCQFNLDAYQQEMSRHYEPVSMPVVYFTQLMGLAFGLEPKVLGLQRCIVPLEWKPAATQAASAS